MVAIEFADIVLRIDEQPILRNINLTITERRVGIIGTNGSGKSTLVKTINGLCMPSAGCVKVNNTEVNKKTVRQIRRMVGFVFQNPQSQIVMPEVKEDLKFGLKNIGSQNSELVIGEVAETLGIEDLLNRKTYQLSGGEKQMVALAAILVTKPEVLIFDEPTTYLDLVNLNKLIRVIDALPQQVIVISHNLDILQTFDRVILMHQGCVVNDGQPKYVIAEYVKLCANV